MEVEETATSGGKIQQICIQVLFCLTCLAVNVAGSAIAGVMPVPLFLDNIGTIVASIMGGPIAGIVAGYCLNVINNFNDGVSIYYGVISIIIAVVTHQAYRLGWFKKFSRIVIFLLGLAVITGGLSTVITWSLFGFGFSGGVSTPLAISLSESLGHNELLAQFVADYLVDLFDKTIVLMAGLGIVWLLRSTGEQSLEIGLWMQTPLTRKERDAVRKVQPRIMSLRAKVALVLSIIMVVLSVVTAAMSHAMFDEEMVAEVSTHAFGVTKLASKAIDVSKVNAFLANGEREQGYAETEHRLAEIRDSFDDVSNIYVYQIREDGCHVVLDPDTEDMQGAQTGEVVPIDKAFELQKELLLQGKPVEPVVSHESNSWMLTAYQPLYDQSQTCVAYVAADITMEQVRADGFAFLARIATLFAGFFALIYVIVLWMSDYGIILPLNTIAHASSNFVFGSADVGEDTVEQIRRINITTADEIENLYKAILKTSEDTVRYIDDAQRQSDTIERMQANLIMVMADLVESRDHFTGEHVRKTAAYTAVIMEQMRKEGAYVDQLTDAFVDDVIHSAPLHDIGKICVPDAILNKPGRLTEDEFRVMQNHTVAGAQILEHAVNAVSDPTYLDEARRLALSHHEKWNGQGYPEGLKGLEIPLSARIMAVADVFDALVSKRSYKEGFPIEKALDIIREGVGTHFDPLVAQAFLDAEDEVRHIAEQNGDDSGTQLYDVHDQ